MADENKEKTVSLGFPFDSKQQRNSEGQFYDDREYLAADFARYFKQFIGNGIYAQPANGLKVFSSGFMGISVNKGEAFVDGYYGHSEETVNLILDEGDATYARIDRVVMRLNLLDRMWQIAIVKGTPESVPKAPALNRYVGEAGNYYELGLATIYVKQNATSITDAEITDTRLDDETCGIVAGVVDQVDMTDLYKQFQSFLEQNITQWTEIKKQQETAWTQQTTKQQQDFTTQLQAQQTEYQKLHDEIQGWYNGVKNDIAKLLPFDFDNLAALSGVTRKTTESGTTITEEIFNTLNSQKVATRVTNTDTLEQVITLYDESGLPKTPKKRITTDLTQPDAIAVEKVEDVS